MPRIALVQQKAGPDRANNLERALEAMGRASEAGAGVVLFAELAGGSLLSPAAKRLGGQGARGAIPGPLSYHSRTCFQQGE